MRQIWILMWITVLGIIWLKEALFAQTMPNHTRLLYQASLSSEKHEQLAINNFNGSFVEGKGWSPRGTSSQLRIQFPDYLPPEGTVEFKVTSFDPANQAPASDGKYNIASLDSRGDGFDNAYGTAGKSTDGSWLSFQVMREDATPAKRGLQVYTGYRGFDSHQRKDHPFNEAWNPNRVYTFKLIWNKSYAWLVVNGLTTPVSLPPNDFEGPVFGGQLETFLYLQLGYRAGLVNGGLPGPVYSDLKVYTNEAHFIFKDVSFSSGVYGGVNKKGEQGVAIAPVAAADSLDIYITNTGNYDVSPFQALPNRFYHPRGTQFVEQAATRGLNAPEQVKYQAIFFDMDNDGDYDVFITRNYYDNSGGVSGLHNLLFRNDNGQFVDVTPAAMASTKRITQAGVAVDIDNDGDVDLVGMNRFSDHETYLNDGKGNFTLVNRGIGGSSENRNDYCQGMVAGDVNNDGYEDIIVVKQKGSQDLFINSPGNPGFFQNEAGNRNFSTTVSAKSAFLADFNNDGSLDIFVTSTRDGQANPKLQVFQNNGTGVFSNRAAELNIDSESFNVLLADINNDGYQDIFMATSNKELKNNRFKVHLNNKTGGFTLATTSGLGYLGSDARGTAMGDFNNDGKVDFMVVCRNNHNYLLQNQTENGLNFLKCNLVSPKGMAGGFGARVFIYQAGYAGNPAYLIGMRHATSANGYLNQNSPILHFGVGAAQAVDVIVQWPGASSTTYANVTVNQTLEVGGAPGSMRIESGNLQNGTLGRPLATPFVVGVYDGGGSPAPNVPVTFTVQSGGGQLSNTQPVYTNAQGQAATILTLGSLQTSNSVEAASPGLTGSPVTFTATAVNGFPNELQVVKGASQTAAVNAVVSDSVTVRLKGDTGQPVPNYPVRFQVTAGGGSLNAGQSEVEILTDSYGLARVAWKLGTVAGTQAVQASASWNGTPVMNSPLSVNAIATAGPATQMKYASGNNQSGAVGQPLSAPFCVQISDSYNNPVGGYSVQYVVTAGGGNFNGTSSNTVISDPSGLACAVLTLGPNMGTNNNTAEARASGLGSPIPFVASANISNPNTMTIVSGDHQTGQVTRTLADSFVVVVKDEFGNKVPGVEVIFTVTAGNGNLGGSGTKNSRTNGEGRATALLTLGPVAGQDNNQVRVTATALPQVILNFTASALPGNAVNIGLVSGNEQTGTAGTTLPEPLLVKVIDNLNNPVSGQPVTFAIQGSEGNLEGNKTQLRYTDAGGLARISVTLGSSPGTMVVHATSTINGQALSGSPVIFNLYIRAGQADSIFISSGNYQTGFVDAPLKDSLRVKVVDSGGYVVSGQQVIFTVKSGGGNLNGLTYQVVTSNRQGIAAVLPTLGPNTGIHNNIFQAQANGPSAPLKGSPVDFIASAKASAATQLQLVDGNNQVGTVGQLLPKLLKVKVIGSESESVANHPVLFTVTGGNGSLDGLGSVVEKRTNSQGFAEVSFRLGTIAGMHRVEATATDGMNPLIGSPLLFVETALVGAPDANESTINATSPISADGMSKSEVIVTIYDTYKNPISGKTILLTASGTGNTLIQPTSPTDTRGITRGYLASTVAETKAVGAIVIDNNLTLARTTPVKFTAGRAKKLSYFSGNSQTGHIGSYTPEPLIAQVTDSLGNGVQGYPVEFVITSGSGRLVESQPIFTDSLGKARANLVLGQTPGTTVRVEARAPALTGTPVAFICTALVLKPTDIAKIAGDSQKGGAGSELPDSLVVRVTGEKNASMWGVPVYFNVLSGGGRLEPATAFTNEQGYAWSRFILGTMPGLNEAQASINDLAKTIIFRATGEIGSPAVLQLVSGDGGTGTVNSPLEFPLVARVTDIAKNPCPGAQVLFTPVTGGAILTPSQPSITNAQGQASAWISLGSTIGEYQFKVKVIGTAIPEAFFRITALPGPAQKMILSSGNNQVGRPLNPLPQPLAAQVLDEFGNGVSDVEVFFSVGSGGGAIIEKQPLKTGVNGTVSAQWQLGREQVQTCIAKKDGLVGSPLLYTAYLAPNRAPDIRVVADTTIQEEQILEFYLSAVDPEGDSFTFGVRNLPRGAGFDSTGTFRFIWRPENDQSGTYPVVFVATDAWGAVSSKTVTIRVLNNNRAPSILSFSPTPLTLPWQPYYVQLEFCVTAVDPDQDALFYHWEINDLRYPAGSCLTVVPNPSWPPLSLIRVWISDGSDSVSIQWSIVTKVKLNLFAASYLPFKGVQVHWETASESGNAGFNLLRSRRQDGNYEPVNKALLTSKPDQSYYFTDSEVKSGETYFYILQDVDVNGSVGEHGPIQVPIPVPQKYELAQNYPNPFNPTTTIQFSLPQSGQVRLTVFNVAGQRVRTLIDDQLSSGFHQCIWNGIDDGQQRLSSGVYYYVLQANQFREVRKLLLLK